MPLQYAVALAIAGYTPGVARLGAQYDSAKVGEWSVATYLDIGGTIEEPIVNDRLCSINRGGLTFIIQQSGRLRMDVVIYKSNSPKADVSFSIVNLTAIKLDGIRRQARYGYYNIFPQRFKNLRYNTSDSSNEIAQVDIFIDKVGWQPLSAFAESLIKSRKIYLYFTNSGKSITSSVEYGFDTADLQKSFEWCNQAWHIPSAELYKLGG